jgi:predicted transcriptional regulator
MYSSKRLMVDFAAVVATLADETRPVPASSIYLALGSDLTRFEAVKTALVASGVVQATSETVALTPKGRELATKLAEVTG